MITNFSRRIKLLVTKKDHQASRIKTKRPQNLGMAKVFSHYFLFPVPYGNCYTLIKLLLLIAKSEGTFPSVGGFIYCVCSPFHYTRNLSSSEYILLLSGSKILNLNNPCCPFHPVWTSGRPKPFWWRLVCPLGHFVRKDPISVEHFEFNFFCELDVDPSPLHGEA